MLGARWDTIDMEVSQPVDKLLLASSNNFTTNPDDVNAAADDTVDGWSWTASLSWSSPVGLRPYVTASEQSTLIAGQGAELQTGSVSSDSAFDTSELLEGA